MGLGLNITIEDSGDRKVVRIKGRLDATSSPLLEKQISELVREENKKILIDFAKVDYLSSAGMRLLLSATKKLKAAHGKLAVCGMNDDLMEIVKMAGFEKILAIYPRESEALMALE